MTDLPITIEPTANHEALTEQIEEQLLQSLAGINTQSVNESIVLTAKNDDGALIGGLSGSTSYGWFLIKLFWVAETSRGTGLGKRLMQEAEDHARSLGCHSAWLDTSNADARAFYLRLGYADFGVLENGPAQVPSDHARWFMKKTLLQTFKSG